MEETRGAGNPEATQRLRVEVVAVFFSSKNFDARAPAEAVGSRRQRPSPPPMRAADLIGSLFPVRAGWALSRLKAMDVLIQGEAGDQCHDRIRARQGRRLP